MPIHFDAVLHQRNTDMNLAYNENSNHESTLLCPRRSSGRCIALVCPLLFFAFSNSGCKRPDPPAAEKVPPAPIKWETPRQVAMEEWTELVGTTQPLPDHAARVTAPVGGRVVAVLPRRGDKPIVEGQAVEEGDVLVKLDATLVLANLAKAEAAKKVLQAEREVANINLKQANVDLKALEELQRSQNTQRPLVSPLMLDKAKLAVESAQAAILALDYKLEAAEKEEAALKLEIKLYTLAAPRKGRLGRLQVVLGQTLSAGSPVAEVLGIDNEIDVLCFVSAADARKLQIGQPAHVIDAEKESNTQVNTGPQGKVVYIADQAELETGSFAVKVRFPNNDLKLRANSVARVSILTKQTKPGESSWVIPESALMEDQDPPGIIIVENVVVSKNAEGKEEQIGKARRLKAIIGMRSRYFKQVEILRLEDPDKKWHGDLEHTLIVIEKGLGLQTGDSVKFDDDDDEDAAKPDEKP